MNTAPRAPSFVGLFDTFTTRTPFSLLRSQGVTPAPIVPAPDVSPDVHVSPRVDVLNKPDVDASAPPTESKPVSESPGQDLPHTRRGGNVRAIPQSALWAARRLKEDKLPESALAVLRCWTHNRRLREVTYELVDTLNDMNDEHVIQALYELAQPMHYVRSAGRKRQTTLSVVLQTMEFPRRSLPVNALLDSGCTGSCIDEDFVRRNGISTRKTALPIPVYNADGSANSNGSITEFVDIAMTIGDHEEKIALAVAKLGTASLFIGH